MEKDYIPFGEEWKKEVSKVRKAGIIEMLATVCHERDLLRKVRPVQNPALDLIAAEREKQIRKGYTMEHDVNLYEEGDLLWLAHRLTLEVDPSCPEYWNEEYWKKLLALPYIDRVRIAATWYAKELEILLHLTKSV